ncbi:uncharacterized protein LOC126828265 [Patella vulgata]|uniref:uncharacterized protein LOC126828265 n=1 Tax=Patella vulgata TaxID=6465 RepID=UPI00217F9804|nr:uncharacterized protein LOC126828265 [Patella vulgata]
MKRRGEGTVVIDAVRTCQPEVADSIYQKCQASCIKHSYPLKFLIPQYASETNCCWVYPITYGGGLVEGDHIDIAVHIKQNCCAVITSQESTKVYSCEKNIITKQMLQYQVDDHALLCLLGDPVVCFKGASYTQSQEIHMTSEGSIVLLDLLSAGRIARGESWQFTSFKNSLLVYIDDQPVLNEVNHLESTPWLSVHASMSEYEILGTCIVIGNNVKNLVEILCKKYSAQKKIGEREDKSLLCSISNLEYTIEKKTTHGCYLRFLTSISKAYEIIDEIVQPLLPIIGTNPYHNKY